MTATSVRLPAQDPFTALAAHFGMLLGVADVQTMVGHTWAKQRLHNSWLHGPGVVWGLGVSVVGGRVQVDPGLCLDDAGHELYLASAHCEDLRAWRAEQDDDLGADRTAPFDAHVVARFRACLSDQVPALSTICEGGGSIVQYARLTETMDLLLVPKLGTRTPDRFRRLRRFLAGPPVAAVEPADYRPGADPAVDVARARAAVHDADPADRPAVTTAQLRILLAYDGIDRKPPAGTLFAGPDADPAPDGDPDVGTVLLADLRGVTIPPGAGDVTVDAVDYAGRPGQVDTLTLPELVPVVAPTPDSAGPRAVPGSGRIERVPGANPGDPEVVTVRIEVTGPVLPGSIERTRSVAALDAAAGWAPVPLTDADYVAPDVVLTMDPAPAAGVPIRVVLAGTGPVPIVADLQGAAGIPSSFAGLAGGPPVPVGQGADAVLVIPG